MKMKLRLIAALLIFGSVGVFVKWIDMPSTVIVLVRSAVGVLCLLPVVLVRRSWSWEALRRNWLPLLVAGLALAGNWVLLFQSYRYTTVAVSSMCNYLAPVFVLALSPLLLKERLTAVKAGCIAAALGGMVLIAGLSGGTGGDPLTGIALAIGAAVLYAALIFANKFQKDISPAQATLVELSLVVIVLLPYVLISGDFAVTVWDGGRTALLLVCGVVHTGLAYLLYFAAVNALPAQTVAIMSYLDPLTAVVMSTLLLGESMTVWQVIGGVMILGATLVCELWENRKKRGQREETVV